MTTNLWVESYLDALMRAGEPTGEPIHGAPRVDADRRLFANYYVQQILNWSEEGIRKAWSRANASAGRNPAEKDYRLAYLTWRVWHMRQKKAKVDAEEARRSMSAADADTELGNASELESTLDENEDVPASPRAGSPSLPSPPSSPRLHELLAGSPRPGVRFAPATPPRLAPLPQAEVDLVRGQPLYFVLISLHGLVRGHEMELGRDSDTGGQVKYVVELSRALARHPGVHRVDLLTRLITDPSVDKTYSVREEPLLEPEEHEQRKNGGGAFIVRLAAGNPDVYLRKELLWPFIREFADRTLEYVRAKQQELAGSGVDCRVLCTHGHYADAAEIACMASSTLGTLVVVTGHSLGRNKLNNLLISGKMTRSETEAQYRIGRRIEAEERALDHASVIFTSTVQEIDSQWGLNDGFDSQLQRALSRTQRATGRWVPRVAVIPPGLDFARVKPIDLNAPPPEGDEEPPIWREISKFLRNPRKPAILALARPDAKKNLHTLIRAYGENATLRELANLVLFCGNRDSVDAMSGGARRVMEGILKQVDALDLYGSVAIPKHHRQEDVTDIYAFAASTKGAFALLALQEPFGLVLIEAAAHGVPTVSTCHGGPVEIHATLKNGLLVEPTDSGAVADALVTLLTDRNLWETCRNNGLEHIHEYSWEAHCKRYVAVLDEIVEHPAPHERRSGEQPGAIMGVPVELMPAPAPQRMLVVAMCTRDAREGAKILRRALDAVASHGSRLETLAVVVASALPVSETLDILDKAGVPQSALHAVVADAGGGMLTRTAGEQHLAASEPWQKHISFAWQRAVVLRAVLQVTSGAVDLSPLSMGATASPHLLRFSLAPGATAIPALHVVMRRLRRRGVRVTLHYSAGAWELRALPLRASRALAVRYLAQQWGVPLKKVVVLASQASDGDGDRAELFAGLVHSVLVGGAPPPSPRTANRAQPVELAVSADDMAIAAAHVNRTTWLDADDEMEAALLAALANKEE